MDETEKKRRKSRRRHKKDIESVSGKGKDRKRRSTSAIKRKLSRKLRLKYGKQKDSDHLHKTIEAWKLRWKNRVWRQKWKSCWGKGKWKPSIRKRWNSDKKWRRKCMKKIVKKWWDKKWRRKWMKRWIDNRWLNKWNRKRIKRKRLWKQRWRKSGAKRMGLTFNEFLLAERRLKAIQRVPPDVINQRRREKRLRNEKRMKEKHDKEEQFQEEIKKLCISERIHRQLFHQEFYGPETFGIRPSVIQFKFYMMNMIQGIAAFSTVMYFHLSNDYKIPPEFALQGLYTLVYFANAMDFYGSLFGMITSYHLETYYDRGGRDLRGKEKSKGQGCLNCFQSSRKENDAPGGVDTESLTATDPKKDDPSVTTEATSASIESGSIQKIKETQNVKAENRSRRTSKSRGDKNSKKERRASGVTHTTGKRRHSESRKGKRNRASVSSWQSQDESSKIQLRRRSSVKSENKTLRSAKSGKCQCRGLGLAYCSMIRRCFRRGRSREFINRMGYCSWILLQLAWFLNIFFSAYYTWLELYYKAYGDAVAQCTSSARMKHCDEFDSLFIFLSIVVGTTFALRNIFTFVIGMCFPERYLKHCKSDDPNDEIASTCSDTDIDFSKVPRQILIPHILSDGKYPYVLPGPSRPVDYMLQRISKVTEKNKKLQEKKRKLERRKVKRKSNRRRRRILSTYEKEAAKLLAGFKQMRQAHIPLRKGRRRPTRIPVAAGVTDVQQLPPDLMTTKAWAWLYVESDSSDNDDRKNVRKERPVQWRRRKKRKLDAVDSASLTVLPGSLSKAKLNVDANVKEKAKDLSDRESTDSSWSGASLFESASGYSSDDEGDNKDDNLHYLILMKQMEELEKGHEFHGEEDEHHHNRP